MPTTAAEQQVKRARVKSDFDRLINMSVAEMQSHFSGADSDLASLNPKLSPNSGKALGKRALVLKAKESWEETDFNEAETLLRPLRFQLSRAVRYADKDGTPTLFCTALRNRGHDPLKVAGVTEAEQSIGRKLERVRSAVQDALRLVLPPRVQPDGRLDEPYVWISTEDIYETHAVAQWESEGVYLSVPYSWDGDDVEVTPEGIVEVERSWTPKITVAMDDVPAGELTEVAEAEGDAAPTWVGKMMTAGTAKNRSVHNGLPREYLADMLKAAVAAGKFDNVPAYDRTDTEHLQESEETKIGTWGKAAWDETKQAVVNTFTFLAGKYPKMFDKKIRTAISEGKVEDLPGCSITGDVRVARETPNVITSIEEVRSCDWISYASAGGGLLAIQESDSTNHTEKSPMKLITATKALAGVGLTVPAKLTAQYDTIQIAEGAAADFMLAQLEAKRPKMFEKNAGLKDKLGKDEELLVTLFGEFMEAEGVDPAPADTPTEPDPVPVAEAAEDVALRGETRKLALEGIISASNLPEAAATMIRKRFASAPFNPVAIQEAVQEAKDFMAAVSGSAAQSSSRIDVRTDGGDKLRLMVNDFFTHDIREASARVKVAEAFADKGGVSKTLGRPITPQELYRALTGDTGLTFKISEAMDTTLATAILVEGMQTRMLYSFNLNPSYQSWKRIVRPATKMNFKTNEAIGAGGFTGYATKTKSAAFGAITETGATKETYALLLRGGMFNLSYEDILNDDVDYVAGLPGRLGDYAARMLSAYMWSLVTSNPTLAADSTSVFDNATHVNYMTDALDETPLTTAIGKLMAQTYPNSTDKMGLTPKTLVTSYSTAQIKKAYELITSAYGNSNVVADWAQQLGIQHAINPHTTDLTDWYLFADPMVAPIIEAGFLNGNMEPEIMSAMQNGVGDWFTKRDAQFRIEHAYNAAWVSYKGAVGAIVAD